MFDKFIHKIVKCIFKGLGESFYASIYFETVVQRLTSFSQINISLIQSLDMCPFKCCYLLICVVSAAQL